MVFTNRNLPGFLGLRQGLCLIMMVLCIVSLSVHAKANAVEEEGDVQHFKMLSTIEYSGKGQFKNQAETFFTTRKQVLFNDNVRYYISTNDFDLGSGSGDSGGQDFTKEISFVVDRKTGRLSAGEPGMAFLGKVNNQCIKSLSKVSKADIGKTWKQSFNLAPLGKTFPKELKFTMNAIEPETKMYGKMIVVRAISEPFIVQAAREDRTTGDVSARINSAYLFDTEFEDIYMSVSAFEATTKINGYKEQLRHEVATYKTNAAGSPVDLTGVEKDFEKFMRKIGLRNKSLKVEKQTSLPRWTRSEGLLAAQTANICAAVACEGAINPVATVYVPMARTIAMQSVGQLASASQIATVSGALAQSVPGIATLKIAVAPAAFMGMSATTAGLVAGGSAVAVSSGGSGGSSSRSGS